jgi:MurNAc alpha-1-phosphate uridylyltransferase
MTKISQAFIFAAGRGERMKPVTDSIPKPLVKIKNKAIIDYSIEKLLQISSLKKIIINGFYLAEQIEAHIKNFETPHLNPLPQGERESRLIFSREVEKIETGGGLLFAKDKIDFDEPLLTINGDILWQENLEISDLELMQQSWNYFSRPRNKCGGTNLGTDYQSCHPALVAGSRENYKRDDDIKILLGLKKKEEFLGYEGEGDFNFDEKTGMLTKFPGSKMSHVFVGLQIINPKILFNAPKEKCFSMSYFYKSATGDSGLVKGIRGVELPGKYFHIGTVDAIKMTEESLSQ